MKKKKREKEGQKKEKIWKCKQMKTNWNEWKSFQKWKKNIKFNKTNL